MTWRAVLPHIDALAEHIDPDTDALAQVLQLGWTATFLEGQGSIQRALTYCTRGLAGAINASTVTSPPRP